MENKIPSYLEWEVLNEGIIIDKIIDNVKLPSGQKKIEINRDKQYNISAKIFSKEDDTFDRKVDSYLNQVGFIDFFDVFGSAHHGLKNFHLESCCYIRNKRHYNYDLQIKETEAELFINGLKIKYKSDLDGTWLTEWFINGPRNHIFRNSTSRKISTKFIRERSTSQDDTIYNFEISNDYSESSKDILRVKTNDIEFLITKVPENFGPNWSANIGIEYRKEWGRIPDLEEREKINELCSFIFGRQLLSVGYSIYDKNTNLVEEYATNPRIKYSPYICLEPDNPPIKIDYPSMGVNAEEVISNLLPYYIKVRESFHLKEALYLYWIARNMPIGTDLPLYASAVEAIKNGFLSSNISKTHGVYMDKNEFESLLREEMISIENKLKDKPYGLEIIRALKGSYRMGTGDKFKSFFNDIKLDLDTKEENAIKARHKMAHGGIIHGSEEIKQLIQFKFIYETLLHKIILRLLGFSGNYIDHSDISRKDKYLSAYPKNQ